MNEQLTMFPTDIRLHRINPERNMRRFYRMRLQPDLFGGCLLVREWGRIGTQGRNRNDLYPDEGLAMTAMMALTRAKQHRGYCTPAT